MVKKVSRKENKTEPWDNENVTRIYHCNKIFSDADKNRKDDVAKGDDKPENKNDVEDHGDRPAKPTKRRQSEPKPICTINPNVKQGQKVSQKAKKAKSTPAAKETLHLA